MTTVAIFGLALISNAQVPNYIPSNGLVGWWPFNGNANDESGNNNNGGVYGAGLTNDRNNSPNSAFVFNGSSDYIQCLNAGPSGNPTITLSFWIKTSQSNYASIFSYGDDAGSGNSLRVGLNGGYNNNTCAPCISFDTYDNAKVFNTTLNNVWDNYIVVYDGTLGNTCTISKIYKNGLLLVNVCFDVNISTTNISSLLPITFGKFHGPSAPNPGYFLGSLDDIGIWNRVLTPQEITDLYNGCQLTVSTQPNSQTINISNNAQFIVGSSDPSATFQWQTDLGVGFQNLNSVGQYSGTANDTLTVGNITMSNNNQPFRCIINSGSCSDTSNVTVLTVNNNVGINEFTQDNLFSVYPNPAKSQINVKADAKLLGSIYTVYNNSGKVVLSGKINSENTVIELGNLSGGIYLFSVGENLKQTFKVIKE